MNLISVSSAVLLQITPLMTAWAYGPDLGYLIPSVVVTNFLSFAATFWRCKIHVFRGHLPTILLGQARSLLAFGGWVTVTSLVGPFMVVLDRFVIGAMTGASAVTYYIVPFQLAQRTAILPGSLTSALFPRFAAANGKEREQLSRLAIQTLAVVMTPLFLVALLVVDPFFRIWISADFASKASVIAQILLLGFWINAIAFVPYTELQAAGKPGAVAKCHLAEVIPYFVALSLGLSLSRGAWSGVGLWAAHVRRLYAAALSCGWSQPQQCSQGPQVPDCLATGGIWRGCGHVPRERDALARCRFHRADQCWMGFLERARAIAKRCDRLFRQPSDLSQRRDTMSFKTGSKTKRFDQAWTRPWPQDGLETLGACPICSSAERKILYDGLVDNVFFCAPGKWTMWFCSGCRSAYLDPRPSTHSIGLAYSSYYTHRTVPPSPKRVNYSSLKLWRRIRRQLFNGYKNWRYGTREEPALGIGAIAFMLAPPFRNPLDRRYRSLPRLPVRGGSVLDVGCGDGTFMELASSLGWNAIGIDPDPAAVANCLSRGVERQPGNLGAIRRQGMPVRCDHA